jgi:glycogen operon protein
LGFYLIMNAYWEPLDFELPAVTHDGGTWRRWIDTALESPNEIVEWRSAVAVPGQIYRAEGRSVVMLAAGSGFVSSQDAHP